MMNFHQGFVIQMQRQTRCVCRAQYKAEEVQVQGQVVGGQLMGLMSKGSSAAAATAAGACRSRLATSAAI